ncbi:unnamed protein product [Rodentolepis nana]|uniref:BK_channel_a domain-containing protein n=1 Tax=Rodentolepis nana TaxID=102285 RepID=A0A0R3TUD5_RODNA|nr:unnamed protein product [Rodentolepis nana]
MRAQVGILVLCQQRSLPQSSRALMTVQCQETLLIQLLNTIPRNAITAQIIVPLVCKLMGLRLSSSQQYLTEVANPEDWWWSALGPLVHPDVFPVHVVAELLFGHLLQGESSNPCIGDLAYYVVVRAMRIDALKLPHIAIITTEGQDLFQMSAFLHPISTVLVVHAPAKTWLRLNKEHPNEITLPAFYYNSVKRPIQAPSLYLDSHD